MEFSKGVEKDDSSHGDGTSVPFDSSNLLNPADSAKIRAVQTDERGRILVATKDFSPGDVLFQEKPFVYGSWHNFRCIICNEPHKSELCDSVEQAFSNLQISSKTETDRGVEASTGAKLRINEIETELSDIEGVDELDRARTLLKCLQLYAGTEKTKTNLLQVFEKLTTANLEQCEVSAAAICKHEKLSKIIPEGMTSSLLAKIISGLNTNCHTLEDIGGSGLFQTACICEHSCLPNCSFSTHGTTLTLCAVSEIKKGESLTLDYGENYYKPTNERLDGLQESYGFICHCPACDGAVPDRCRAFVCPNDKSVGSYTASEHIVAPPLWKCLGCDCEISDDLRAKYIDFENNCLENPPESLDEVKYLLEKRIFLKEHYVIFDTLDAVAHEIAAECDSASECIEQELELIWKAVIDCIELTLPEFHHIKVIYYDQFAQIYVKLGDKVNAKKFYEKAFHMAEKVIGPSSLCATTLDLEKLAENPPASVNELMKRYNNIKEIEEQLLFEDDGEALQSFRNLS